LTILEALFIGPAGTVKERNKLKLNSATILGSLYGIV
jgi:hypothetical protein